MNFVIIKYYNSVSSPVCEQFTFFFPKVTKTTVQPMHF